MSYSRWATREELLNRLEPVNLKMDINKSGMPMTYDDKFLYIDDKETHNLVIGTTGSGKTQSTILPIIRLSLMAKESLIVNDPKGELYKKCANAFKEDNYNVLVLDFENTKYGNNWNPLKLPYELYKNDDKDKSIKLVEDLAYYLFYEENSKNIDPFWTNSIIDYFTGIVLYLFENAKEDEINLSSVNEFSSYLNIDNNPSDFLKKINQKSNIYSCLVGTLSAPVETRGSILAVFNQKIKKYTSRENLTNMLSANDFDLFSINTKPTALFIVGGISSYSNNLIPLFVSQVIEAISLNQKTGKRLNILLDEFDSLVPIINFYKTIDYCRTMNIKITVVIKSYIHLLKMYSKEEVEILNMCFGNLIYLLSDDIYTLEEISKRCGMHEVDGKVEPLITIEELKTLRNFEAIIITPRIMPIRTKLLPDYEIDWGYQDIQCDIPLRNKHEIKYYTE